MKKLMVAAFAAGALVLAGCSDSDTQDASDSVSTAADNVGDAASDAATAVGDAASDARDQGFIGALNVGNLKFGDDEEVIDEARDVCSDLNDGDSATDVGNDVEDNFDGDQAKARNFVRIAVTAYCPTEVGKLVY